MGKKIIYILFRGETRRKEQNLHLQREWERERERALKLALKLALNVDLSLSLQLDTKKKGITWSVCLRLNEFMNI